MGYWSTILTKEYSYNVGGASYSTPSFIYLKADTSDKHVFGACQLRGGAYDWLSTTTLEEDELSKEDLYRITFTGDMGEKDKYKNLQSDPFKITDGYFVCTTPRGHRGPYIRGTAKLQKYVPTLPSQPTSLNLIGKVQVGKQVKLSWGKSNYFEDEYVLERKVNNGSYIPIYKGKELSTTDVIGYDWDTVEYRVKGVNEDGEGRYKYSSTYNVIKHRDFSIWTKVDGQIKEVGDMGFNIDGKLVKASDLLR